MTHIIYLKLCASVLVAAVLLMPLNVSNRFGTACMNIMAVSGLALLLGCIWGGVPV